MKQWQRLAAILAVFLAAYFAPLGHPRLQGAILESFLLLQEYAREHVLFCLIPAFFIAGAIGSFVSQAAVIRYFGGGAKKWVSYTVASLSGTLLAVCSCTVLPLFAGIYKRGAGIGPATAFLYSGPAINILAIILTARVLGWQLGVARAVGAVLFATVIGLLMAFICRQDEENRPCSTATAGTPEEKRTPVQNAIYFLVLVLILIFAAWGRPSEPIGFFAAIFSVKWYLTAALLAALVLILIRWFDRWERSSWVTSSLGFAEQILPLLFVGVMFAGFLLGRPGTEAGLIPTKYVAGLVGGNSPVANLLAAVAGAFMYFATLTEIPILQGLLGAGMGQGPALALLLAGPALSLPNMLVIRSIIGTRKTVIFVSLVIVMATLSGLIYGFIAGQ